MDRKILKRFLIVNILVVIVDQLTKWWAVSSLKGEVARVYLGGIFRFEYAENTGAFLSLGATLPADLRYWVFNILVTIFLMVASYFLLWTKMSKWNEWGLIFMIAGGIGNLIDRYSYGYVVDFMNLGVGSLRTGIFNIADNAIVVGMVLLLLDWFFSLKTSQTNASHSEPS